MENIGSVKADSRSKRLIFIVYFASGLSQTGGSPSLVWHLTCFPRTILHYKLVPHLDAAEVGIHAVERPEADSPVVERPEADGPVMERPEADSPVVERPEADSPVVERLVVGDSPVVERLAVGERPLVVGKELLAPRSPVEVRLEWDRLDQHFLALAILQTEKRGLYKTSLYAEYKTNNTIPFV